MSKVSDVLGRRYRFSECRHLMHAWEHSGWLRPPGELVQELVCLRCGTVRIDRFNVRSFERVGRSYTYPNGYLAPIGSGLRKHDYTVAMLEAGKSRARKVKWEDEA